MTAEEDIKTLFYSGEKPPYMWWAKFEERLYKAYRVVDKEASRAVYTDIAKTRELVNNRI